MLTKKTQKRDNEVEWIKMVKWHRVKKVHPDHYETYCNIKCRKDVKTRKHLKIQDDNNICEECVFQYGLKNCAGKKDEYGLNI